MQNWIRAAILPAAAAVTFAGAQAADLARPVYKSSAAPVFHIWSGLYIGGHVGGAFSDSTWATDATNNGDFITENHSKDSWIAGGQLGLRYQFPANWVVGIEGMWSGVDLSTNAASPTLAANGLPNRFRGTDISSLYSVTGQVGYAWDRLLVYAKGGWAGADVELSTLNANNGVASSVSGEARGWTVGGGAEYAFAPNWSFAIEYGYYDLDMDDKGTIQSNGSPAIYRNFETEIHTVTGRVNFSFDWDKAPVVAKY